MGAFRGRRRLDCLCGTQRRGDEQRPRVHFQAPEMTNSRMPQGLHLETGQIWAADWPFLGHFWAGLMGHFFWGNGPNFLVIS